MPAKQRVKQAKSISSAIAKIEASYDLCRFLARDTTLSEQTKMRLAGFLNGQNLMYEEFGRETPADIVQLTQIWNGEVAEDGQSKT